MIEIKVDDTKAMARFGASGIPEAVRARLRTLIPDLTKRLGAQVDANLTAGLKSRNRLEVKKEMVETANTLVGRVRTIATAPPEMLPTWLESGTRAHEIAARNANSLAFFWDRVGQVVFFKRVNHPGFAGIHYTQQAFDSMRDEIVRELEGAVREGAASA